MHNLIPYFIYAQYQAGQMHGRLQAVTLFMDIAGFTAMTQALMEHGKEGAELLAEMINRLFEPIINTVYERGGFITGFAGDAFTAVFPQHDEQTALTACLVALAIDQTITQKGQQQTKFGRFNLAATQGLAAGEVEWGIVGPAAHRSYFFRGEAIVNCVLAENAAVAGDIIIAPQLQALLPPQTATLQPAGANLTKLTAVQTDISPPLSPVQPAVIDRDTMAAFFPLEQWHASQQGEFRNITTLFVSIQGTPPIYQTNDFISHAIRLVNQFEGFFAEIEFGDKGGLFLVYFGAPTAHEDDVERALNFILALQAASRETPFSWRAGITFGTVYAGYIGIPRRDKYTSLGNVVNLAARMCNQAEWGQLLVSKPVALHPGFDFTALGQLDYKGFTHPVPTYALKGEAVAKRVFTNRMVGREEALQQLVNFMQPLFAGQNAGAVLIYGDPGIGKSHLAYQLSRATGPNVRWLIGQSDPVSQQAFSPFVYLLKQYFSQAPTRSTAENKESFSGRLQELLSSLSQMEAPERLRQELWRTRSFLGALLNLHWPDSLFEQVDAQGRYQNTLIAISVLLQAEALQQPIVLLLEDGHWFDPASYELLTILTRQTQSVPLLILVTSRYADDGSQIVYELDTTTAQLIINLSTLDAEPLRNLIENVLAGNIDDSLYTLLNEKTGANPFFAQQMALYFQENGLIQQTEGGVWGLTTTNAISAATEYIPDTINALLVARIDRLTQQVKEVVQTAAVLGREFILQVLVHMLQADIMPQVTAAEEERIWRAFDELRYIFRHALLRDAAYEMQLRAKLQSLHHLAAATYEQLYADTLKEHSATLAYHYGQAGDEEKMYQYALLTIEQAARNYNHKEALHWLEQALTTTFAQHLLERYKLLLMREEIYHIQANRAAQKHDLDELTAAAAEIGIEEQLTVALRVARFAHSINDHPTSSEASQTAVRLAQALGDDRQEATAYYWQAMNLTSDGKNTAAEEIFLFAKAKIQQIDDASPTLPDILQGLAALAFTAGNYLQSQSYYQQSLEICRRLKYWQREANALNGLGGCAIQLGDYEQGQKYARAGLALQRKIGHRQGEGSQLVNLGRQYAYLGRYDEALRHFQQGLAIFEEVSKLTAQALAYLNIGTADYEMKHYAEAEKAYQAALTLSLQAVHPLITTYAYNDLGKTFLAKGDYAQSRRFFEQALANWGELGFVNLSGEALAGLATLAYLHNEEVALQNFLSRLMAYLEDENIKQPTFYTYRLACDLLRERQDSRYHTVLNRAYHAIQERALNIQDQALRHSFLENVTDRREIVAAWQKAQ